MIDGTIPENRRQLLEAMRDMLEGTILISEPRYVHGHYIYLSDHMKCEIDYNEKMDYLYIDLFANKHIIFQEDPWFLRDHSRMIRSSPRGFNYLYRAVIKNMDDIGKAVEAIRRAYFN